MSCRSFRRVGLVAFAGFVLTIGGFVPLATAIDCPKTVQSANLDPKKNPSGGYLSEVQALPPDAAHTIEDIPKYLSDSLGPETMRAIAEKRSILIVEGDGPDAVALLKEQGWKIEHEVEKPVGFHRVHRISKDGEIRYAITRVNGEDRVIHLQSFLRMAGVEAHRVSTIRNYRNFHAEYLSAFRQAGHEPDLVVYGLTPHVEGTFIDTNGLLERPYHYLKRGDPNPDASDISLRPFKILSLEDGRKVWLFYPLYGDLAREVVQALYDAGARKLLFLGTAGGIDPKLKVGDWVSPISSSTGKSRVSRTAKYERVSTPNIETKDWLQEQNRRGTGMIEVEAGYVIDIARKHPDFQVKIDMILSDVLQGPNKLDLHQIPRVSQIPNLHAGIHSILEEALGKFRLNQVEEAYFPNVADRGLLTIGEKESGRKLFGTAKRLGMQRLGTGIYQKTEVFSGQFGHLYFSADVQNVPPKWAGFKAKLVGNPLHYHVPGEKFVVERALAMRGKNREGLRRLFEIAYEKGAGEVRFVESAAGYDVTVSFALADDAARFDAALAGRTSLDASTLAATATATHGMRSADLEKRVRSAREFILGKAGYRERFKLNVAKLKTKLPETHPLYPTALKIMDALNDPAAFADFVEEILRKTATKSTGVPTVEEYKGAIASVLRQAEAFPIVAAPRMFLSSKEFNAVLASGQPFLDETFLNRTHGAYTHVFQMAYLSKLFEREFGRGGTSTYLKKMGELPDTELWGFLFDSLNDIPNHYSNPEILNQVLWRTFGFN